VARAPRRGTGQRRPPIRRPPPAGPPPAAPAPHLVPNTEIAHQLREIADALEIEGASPFRVRAYRTAAATLDGLAQPAAQVLAAGGRRALQELPGIGESIAGKIEEMLETGQLAQLRRLRREVPAELAELLGIPGLGPKRLHLLHRHLGISSLADLERALARGDLLRLRGFGETSCRRLRHGVELYRARGRRFRLAEVEPYAEALCTCLAAAPGVRRVEAAGSFRRRRETIGDLDLLCSASDPAAAAAAFVGFDAVTEVVARGPTRVAVRLRNGLQVDLRLVAEDAWGAALHYFTGSQEHNVALRTLAKERGYKVSEYGAFRGRRRVAGRSEAEIFALIGARWIPPELRENQGEIQAARQGTLPRLLTLADLRGDLQMHTTATDGRDEPETMARAARAMGHDYIAITEHSQAVRVAGGLDDDALRAHVRALRRLRVPGLRVLCGVEVDIRRDGSLDLAAPTLRALDLVVASVHSHLGQGRDEMTRRMLRAVGSGLVDVLGHPTGRLIGEREPIELDLEAVLRACALAGVAVEINAQPQRLDLCDVHARLAKQLGVRLVISTDAHSADELRFLRHGVDVARRAWLEPGDVLNTLPADDLLAALHRLPQGIPRHAKEQRR
jgi:DNA polymerase (family 10)